METWLRNNNDEDQAWIEGCEFNSNRYKLLTLNRSKHKEGGIVLTHGLTIQCNEIYRKEMRSFQYAIQKCKLAKGKITILGIQVGPTYATLHAWEILTYM